MTDPMTGPAKPILLGGYAAKQCPVRVHNNFAPLVPVPEWVPAPELQALFDAGVQFEGDVFACPGYRGRGGCGVVSFLQK